MTQSTTIKIPNSKIQEKKQKQAIIIYAMFLHFVIFVQTIVYVVFEIPFLIFTSFVILGGYLLFDIFMIVFSRKAYLMEFFFSILFLGYTNISFCVLGGFDVNTALPFVAMLVPLGVSGIYDVSKKSIQIKVILYFALNIICFVISYVLRMRLSLFIFVDVSELQELKDILNVINLITFTLSMFVLLFYVFNKSKALELRAHTMIYDIIPKPVADSIIRNDETRNELQQFPKVTLMFADIVDFTAQSTRMNPDVLFAALNNLFSRFDTIVEDFNLEKIKTIGDAYVVATGIYTPHSPEKMISFAKEILEKKNNVSFLEGKPCQIRIGIHTGSVYGGILGKKYFYDIWGDTVLMVDSICTMANVDKILISSETYNYAETFKCDKKRVEVQGHILDAYEVF